MAPHVVDTFHAFPRLPAEVRCRIWQLAAFPRTLTITRRRWAWERDPKYADDDYFFFCDSVPAVLHTCHESRRWAPYVPSFRNVVFNRGISDRYIWVNFQLDTVRFVDKAIYLQKLSDQDITSIRYMVLHFREIEEFLETVTDPLDRMPNLRSLEIHVACGGLGWWSREVGWLEARFNKWFGAKDDGWECPEIRLIDLESGFQVNRENHLTHCDLAPRPSPRARSPSPLVRGGRGGRGRGVGGGHRGSRGW